MFHSLICDERIIKWFKPHGNEVLKRQQSVTEPLTVVTLSDYSLSDGFMEGIVQPTIHTHESAPNTCQNPHATPLFPSNMADRGHLRQKMKFK